MILEIYAQAEDGLAGAFCYSPNLAESVALFPSFACEALQAGVRNVEGLQLSSAEIWLAQLSTRPQSAQPTPA